MASLLKATEECNSEDCVCVERDNHPPLALSKQRDIIMSVWKCASVTLSDIFKLTKGSYRHPLASPQPKALCGLRVWVRQKKGTLNMSV